MYSALQILYWYIIHIHLPIDQSDAEPVWVVCLPLLAAPGCVKSMDIGKDESTANDTHSCTKADGSFPPVVIRTEAVTGCILVDWSSD